MCFGGEELINYQEQINFRPVSTCSAAVVRSFSKIMVIVTTLLVLLSDTAELYSVDKLATRSSRTRFPFGACLTTEIYPSWSTSILNCCLVPSLRCLIVFLSFLCSIIMSLDTFFGCHHLSICRSPRHDYYYYIPYRVDSLIDANSKYSTECKNNPR